MPYLGVTDLFNKIFNSDNNSINVSQKGSIASIYKLENDDRILNKAFYNYGDNNGTYSNKINPLIDVSDYQKLGFYFVNDTDVSLQVNVTFYDSLDEENYFRIASCGKFDLTNIASGSFMYISPRDINLFLENAFTGAKIRIDTSDTSPSSGSISFELIGVI
jgi:hypothetical protein